MLPGTATFSDGTLVTPLLRRASDGDRRRANMIAFGLQHALSAVVGGVGGIVPPQGVEVPQAVFDNAAAVSLWDLLYGDEAREEAKGAIQDEVEDTLSALGSATAAAVPASATEPLSIKARRRRERMGQEAQRTLLGATVPTVCSYAVSDAAPRMIFIGGQGSILLRSVDRCRTWRPIHITPSEAPVEHVECREEDDDNTLDEILGILDQPDETSSTSASTASAPSKPDIYQVKVSEVGGVVAVCGQDGLLAVGVDSGRTFATYPRAQLDAFENGGRRSFVNKLRSPQRLIGIHGVEFLYTDGSNGRHAMDGPHDGAVALATLSGVFVAGYQVKGLSTVAFTFMYLVLGAQEVGCIRVYKGDLWVSTKGALHYCRAGPDGRMCAGGTVPHKGGTLRSLTPVSPCAMKCFPKSAHSQITQTLIEDAHRVLTVNSQPDKGPGGQRRAYSYSAANPIADDYAPVLAGLRRAATVVVGDGAEGIPFVLFHSMGVGTEVMDYDYSALVAVGCALDAEGRGMLVSTLVNTAYTSLVKSAGIAEKVGTAVALGGAGVDTTLIRSNRSGISTSTDAGISWSAPTHAFTGEVETSPRQTGAPFSIGCGSKQCLVLSTNAFKRGSKADAGCEVVPLNASLRTKLLYTIAAMW